MERVELTVRGQGDGERVAATLFNSEGEAVEQRGQISGTQPWSVSVQRDRPEQNEVWNLQLAKPDDAYFGDVHVKLGDDLPPVVAPEPHAVFRRKD